MSYFKFTCFIGRDDSGEIVTGTRSGHWRAETVARAARKAGIVGQIEFAHNVGDLSGRGRGGHDGRYTIDAKGVVTKKAAWSEFGEEHQ
jgi:hypothetical protein